MKQFRYIFFACVLAFSLTSCDIIEGDKVCTECLAEGTGKKVLIEDFTGHQCGNCPRAHEQLDAFKELYGDDLVVISIHAGGFATVFPALGYEADYTTDLGDALEVHYGADLEGLPIGMVNRREWEDGNVLQKFASWGTQIGAILSETPKMGIELEAEMNNDGDEISIKVDMEYFSTGSASHNLVVVVTEDSIVSKQSDYDLSSGYVQDYEHKHMLRGSVTQGTWGIPVKGADIVAGETFERTFNLPVDPAWNTSHLHIVAYITDNTTKEVLQVEELKM